jgi:hypothetical protein
MTDLSALALESHLESLISSVALNAAAAGMALAITRNGETGDFLRSIIDRAQ